MFGLLLPLLLLVPLRQRSQPDGGTGGRAATRAGQRRGLPGWLDRGIEACLRSLLWPATAEQPTLALAELVARWVLLITLLWMSCCLLAER